MSDGPFGVPVYDGAPYRFKVLDHGFVQLRNIAGPVRRVFADEVPGIDVNMETRAFDADDVDPAIAARVSFNIFNDYGNPTDRNGKERSREADLKLCDYLMKNRHTSPFEMIEVWLEMKMPIFVARQFVRHRTVSINEVSGRYVTLPAEWYIPEVVGGKPPKAKQGQVDTLDQATQDSFRQSLGIQCQNSYDEYLYHLEHGVAAEHARMFLHLNHYTHWLWKQNLHNVMHFLSLRDHSHAQVEAQAYAKAIGDLLRDVLPNCMALYDKYRKQP